MTQRLAHEDEGFDQLRAIGLTPHQLTEALGASNTERRNCIFGHSLKSGPGYYAYNGMLSSLSVQLTVTGSWRRLDPMSMPLLVNDDLGVVLSVSSGDAYTGLRIAGHDPQSRNPKGSLMRELIRLNRIKQESGLFEVPDPPLRSTLEQLGTFQFWLALVHFDTTSPEIRCEVSQPSGSNSRSRVDKYLRRIIVKPYSLAGEILDDVDPNEGFGPISFDVPRR